ncbi:hypothetical protein K3217_05435 [bacterium BD-1]|uniref:hypothetical protein n=1 Tax=Arenimonas sp. TaxID=1872635 RepID=UPI001E2CA8CA|nr:hypothetical protein [Ottowia caeni]
MKRSQPYLLEQAFLAVVACLAAAGLWNTYFAPGAQPTGHHHLHATTIFAWLLLLACQLRLVSTGSFRAHRKLGLAILLMGPLMVASAALLSVHSAQKGLASGRGDFMIVQNVMTTLELALLLWLAFHFKARRKLHGYFLLATGVQFLGISLFFALTSLVPMFRIEGPETFHRFQTAAITGQSACLAVGVIFLFKDRRNAWPMLLAAVLFPFNDGLRWLLQRFDLIGPLTHAVGSSSQALVFTASFMLLLGLLSATGILSRGPRR